MGRPRLHNFPPDQMLRSIARVIQARRDALEAEIKAAQAEQAAERAERDRDNAERQAAGLDYADWAKVRPFKPTSNTRDSQNSEFYAKRDLATLEARGVDYDLEAFTGRNDLTPSARIAAQTSIRQLEAAGLVEIEGARATGIKLTPAGLAAVTEATNATP